MGLFGGGLPVGKVRKQIEKGRDQSVQSIEDASKQIQDTYAKGRTALMEGKSQARQDLSGGVDKAVPYYNQVADLYKGLAPGDMSARAMLLNALNLNGASGSAAARNAFQASPGYQYQLNQGLEADLRNAARTGGTQSGNVLQALQDRGNNLANQDWGDWLNRLTNQSNNIYNDYSGQANALGSLGNLFSNQGTALANVDTGTASNVNNSWQGQGNQINSNYQNIAQANSDRANNLANLTLQNAASKNAANQALWSGVLGLGGQLLSAGGSAGGFGNLFG